MVKTFSEVFHQQAVDEDISATDAAQEDQADLTGFIEYRVDSGFVNQKSCWLIQVLWKPDT